MRSDDQACRSRRASSSRRDIPGARFVPLESENHILLESEPAWADVRPSRPASS